MNASIHRKLAMANRVLNFLRTHPSDDGGFQIVFTRFQEALKRAEELATQEREGRYTARAGVARRKQVRSTLHQKLLPQLVRVGTLAGKEHPELAGKFVPPRWKGRYAAFLTAARSVHDIGQANADLLVKYGLAASLVTDLGEQLGQLEAATQAVDTGHDRHVGARAELLTLGAEIIELVDVLDGFNRYRFRTDTELQAAWDSARNVANPSRGKGDIPPPASGETKAS